MQIYLPIAEMSMNALLLLGLGSGVGFLSGMFGVGGGFLMTPLLGKYVPGTGIQSTLSTSRQRCQQI